MKGIVYLVLFLTLTQLVLAYPVFYNSSKDRLLQITDNIGVSLLDSNIENVMNPNVAVTRHGNKYKYADILPDTDIEYTVTSEQIKEEIILKKQPKFDKIRFFINLSNEEYEFNNLTNEIYVYHSKAIHIAKGIFRQPYYTISNQINYLDINFSKGYYELSLQLFSKLDNNSFPIVIDPSYDVLSGCQENSTHITCTGNLEGSYIHNSSKILVFNDVTGDIESINVMEFWCNESSMGADQPTDRSVSITANVSHLYNCDWTFQPPGWGYCEGNGYSATFSYTAYDFFHGENIDIYVTGGATSCSDSGMYNGGTAYISFYADELSCIDNCDLWAIGGTGNGCVGGDGRVSIDLRSYMDTSSFVNLTNSYVAGVGGQGDVSYGSGFLNIYANKLWTNGTTLAAINAQATWEIANATEIVFFNSTTLNAVEDNEPRIIFVDAESKLGIFNPTVQSNDTIYVYSEKDKNLTIGILEDTDLDNFVFNDSYYTVSFTSFFYPDYENISVIHNSLNYTSEGGQSCGYNGLEYITCIADDETPTFRFQTHNPAYCKLWNESKNWTTLNNENVPDCATTMEKNHVCTFPEALLDGTHELYISCKHADVEINNFSAYPANVLNVTILKTLSASDAIQLGINTSAIWPGAVVYDNQPVLIIDDQNRKAIGTFDKVAAYGDQRWAFNYVSINETPLNVFYNLSPVFYFLELTNITKKDITYSVAMLINSTKI